MIRTLRLVFLALVIAVVAAPATRSQNISTIAGGGATFSGTATSLPVGYPYSITPPDSSGNIYVLASATGRIIKINSSGQMSLFAGSSTPPVGGGNGDGGLAVNAVLSYSTGIAEDKFGNIYVTDNTNGLVREINGTTGIITTVAGHVCTGSCPLGDGGPATSAVLEQPSSLAVDGSGNIYISDTDNGLVRVVNRQSTAITIATVLIPPGDIQTVAGEPDCTVQGDGGQATKACVSPYGIALDATGDIFVSNASSSVREIKTNGIINTVAGQNGAGSSGYSGDGAAATSAKLSAPYGIAVDASGNIFIADSNNNVIREVTKSNGFIYTVAGLSGVGTAGFSGDDGAATSAELNGARGLAVDSSDNIYIADFSNSRVRKVSNTAGTVNHVLGNINTIAGNGWQDYNGDGGLATSTDLYYSSGVAVDSFGNVFIVDQYNQAVRKVAANTAIITTVAGNGQFGNPPNGSAANTAAFCDPQSLALDAFGNVYVAEPFAEGVVEITGGIINKVAGENLPPQIVCLDSGAYSGDGGPALGAGLNSPNGVAVDSANDIFIADSNNNRIRRVDGSTAKISTVAGNGSAGFAGDGTAATGAELNLPGGVALDSTGNFLFIADTDNNRIREVNLTTGIITTVAGNGTPGFSGDGSSATSAELQFPIGVAIDNLGNIFIADTANNRIREVTGGNITTVAGNGSFGYNGDGILATTAWLGSPQGVAVDNFENLYIADTSNSRIRLVSLTPPSTSTTVISSLTPSAYGQSVMFTATVSSSSGTPTGNVNFYDASAGATCAVLGTSTQIGSTQTLSAGTANVSTSTLALASHTILACYIPTGSFASSSGSVAQTVGQDSQTINITQNAPPFAAYNSSFTVTATGGGSGQNIAFTLVNASVCTITGTTATSATVLMGSGTGTCQLTLNQAGTSNYSAAPPVNTAFTTAQEIAQATLTVTGPSSVTYGSTGTATASGGSGTGALSFIASGGGCSVTGTTVSVISVGSPCLLTATMAADSNYNAISSNSFSVTLTKANQNALTVTGPASVTFGTTGTATATGGSGTGSLTFSATGSTGCSVTGTTVSVGNASGTCSLTATMAADSNYNATTSASFSVTLTKANQSTLTVTGPASVTYGTTGTATASGGNGTGALSFSAGTSTGCSVTGSTVTVTGVSGTCSLTATMAADMNYSATTSNSFSVSLAKAALAITPDGGKSKFYGSTFTAFTGTVSGLVSPDGVTVTYQSAGAAGGAAVGSYNITVGSFNFTTGAAANYNITTNTAVNGLTVAPAAASQVVFTSAPFTLTAGQCSSAITLASEDFAGNISNVSSSTPVVLSSNSSAATFYGDNACTISVAGVTISGGTNSVTFYYKDTKSGTPTITATSSLTGPTQQETVNPAVASQLAITTSPFAVIAGQCSATATIASQDAFGNSSNVTGSTQLDLTTGSTGGKFFSDPACQTPIVPVGGKMFVTIPSGSSSAGFFYDDTVPGTLPNQTTTLTAADDNSGVGSLGNTTQAETILHLAFTTSPFLVAQNQCSGQITLTAQDFANHATPVTFAAILGLLSSSSGATFYSDTACTNVIAPSGLPLATDVSVGAGTSSVSFSYKDTAAGTPKLTATIGAYSVAQQETSGAAPAISSANSTTFTVATAGGSFTVTTSGSPAPSLSEVGSLPGGVTFFDNHDGTATLSGTPALGTVNNYSITINATNGVAPDASQSFVLTVQKANQATLTVTGPISVTYGTTGTATVSGGSGTGALSFSAGSSTGCSITGTTVIVTNVGGTCSLTATMAADSNYAATSSAPFAVTLAKASQATLTVTGPASVTYGTTGTATASGGSGTGALTFSAAGSTGCTVTGTTVSVTNASGTCALTVTKAADNNYNSATSISFAVTLNKATPGITFGAPPPATYPGNFTVSAVTNSDGAMAYSYVSGQCTQSSGPTFATTAAGSCTVQASTAATGNFRAGGGQQIVTITAAGKTTPVITWTTPSAITYGTPLSGAQLDATANVAGTFSYSPKSGTVLTAGSQTLTVTFTPTNTSAYTTATGAITLQVNKATPVILWIPIPVVYGTPIGLFQQDALAFAPNSINLLAGSFSYAQSAGTVLGSGEHQLSATFTPKDTTDYLPVVNTQSTLIVVKAQPKITWSRPASIVAGTALGSKQLNATANVPGTFSYTPKSGTVLKAGSYDLQVTFTPTDNMDYTSAQAGVDLTVTSH